MTRAWWYRRPSRLIDQPVPDWKQKKKNEDVTLVEFKYPVFTRMPGKSLCCCVWVTQRHFACCSLSGPSIGPCSPRSARFEPASALLLFKAVVYGNCLAGQNALIIPFTCYLSKLEHIAHNKAKNQNTVKTNARRQTHTHAHTRARAHAGTHRHARTHAHHTHTHTHTHTHLSLIHISEPTRRA